MLSKSQLELAPNPTTVKTYAAEAVIHARLTYRVNLDYSVQSLHYVDSVMSGWKKDGATVDTVTRSLFSLGSYAGEVLLRALPGRWVQPVVAPVGVRTFANLPLLQTHLDRGQVCRPLNLAFLVMADKEREFFRAFKDFLAER